MTKQPSYRFTGLEDDWKEVKLGEVFDIVTDYVANGSFESLRNNVKTYEKDNFAYMIRLQDASNSWKGPWLYTDEKGYNFLSKSRLFKDDILMSNVGTVGRFFQVPELDRSMTLAPNSVLIRSTSSNNQFLYFMMLTANIQDQIAMRKTPGVQDKINKTDFKKVIATLPSLPEQTAIGSFFQDIDQLISLQQRKLEVLKEQKKTYLKLLFPAKGQTKPALRFAGFEDEWKEVKLGEIGEIQTGNTPPTNEEDNYEKNGFPWVTPTDINSLVLHTTSKQLSEVGKSKARIAKSGSILVTCIASIGKNTLVRTDSAFNQQINSLTPSEKYSSYFLLTQSEIWSRYMLSVAGAGTMQIINKSDFSNIKAMVPTLPEQEVIGSFFQDLDKAIAKQEEKVNQLKESKQTLLRKMFI